MPLSTEKEQKEYQRIWYQENKNRLLDKHNNNKKIRCKKRKVELIKLNGGKCIKCGEDNIDSLCFHHIDNKKAIISKLLDRSLERIEKEVKKCVVICYNCHQTEHYRNDRNSIKYRSKSTKHNSELIEKFKKEHSCELCNEDDHRKLCLIFENTRSNVLRNCNKFLKEEDIKPIKILCANCHRNV